MVRSVKIRFDRIVTLAASAISLVHQTAGSVSFTQGAPQNGSGKTEVTLTFPAGIGGSLADGNYTMTIDATKVMAGATNMVANRVDMFYRYYGDKNGDRTVDAADLAAFRATFGKPMADLAFDNDFDFNSDGVVDPLDLAQYRMRSSIPLPPPPPVTAPEFRLGRKAGRRSFIA